MVKITNFVKGSYLGELQITVERGSAVFKAECHNADYEQIRDLAIGVAGFRMPERQKCGGFSLRAIELTECQGGLVTEKRVRECVSSKRNFTSSRECFFFMSVKDWADFGHNTSKTEKACRAGSVH